MYEMIKLFVAIPLRAATLDAIFSFIGPNAWPNLNEATQAI